MSNVFFAVAGFYTGRLIFRHLRARFFGREELAEVAEAPPKGDAKLRKKSYAIYIYKVLKKVHPDMEVSSKAMSIVNSFIDDIFERIAAEASRIAVKNKRSIVTSQRDPDRRPSSFFRMSWPKRPSLREPRP